MRSSALRFAFVAPLIGVLASGCGRDDKGKSTDPGHTPAGSMASTGASSALERVSHLRRRFVTVDEEGLRFSVIPRGEATKLETAEQRILPSFGPRPMTAPRAADVSLPIHADQAFHVGVGDVAIDVRMIGATSASAELAGDAVLYEGAVLGGTLVHVPLRVGTEEFVVVPQKPAQSQLRYDVALASVAGLRLVSGVLEVLDAAGNPMLRTTAPKVVDANGTVTVGTLALEGCAADTSAALPWGRPTTPPGSSHCTVVTSWSDEGLTYPLLVDPAWTTTGVLAQKRSKHRQAAITGTSGVAACTSGCVLVTGGVDFATLLASTELYNASTKTFAAAADMPVIPESAALAHTRFNHACIDTGEGRVIIAGGQYGASAVNTTASTAIYSPATGAWTALGSLGVARAQLAGAMTFNGTAREVVVTGGTANGTAGLNAVDAISIPLPSPANWRSTGATLKTARFAHAMAGFLVGSVSWYVVGGGGPTPEASVDIEPSSGLGAGGFWTELGVGLSSGRKGLGAVVVGDGVLFGGGIGAAGAYSLNVDKFLFSTQAMISYSATLTTPRGYPASATVGKTTLRALFAGGEIANSPAILGTSKSDVLTTGGSVLSGDMAFARDYAQASTLPDGSALVTGGFLKFDTAITYPTSEELFLALPNGAGCGGDFDCDSTHCVDGVCCNTTCTGQCQACNLASSKGTCSTVGSGNAVGGRTACDKFGTTCGSSCDGTFPDKCHYAVSSVSCGAASCAGGSETHATTCDGSGGCNTATTAPCLPYKCNLGATACLLTCTSISDCATGYKCDGSNHCVTTGGPGAACTLTAECSGTLTCLDGVCCSSSVCPGGQKCNVAPSAGTCKLPYGTTCSVATATQCATGNCVDGVCCDTACTGKCEACDAPVAGACTAVVGAPHGGRGGCGGSGTCDAQCNGSTRTACGAFPGGATPCSAPSCSSGSATPGSTCNGFGACTPVSSTACNPYVCATTACKTNCGTTADCSTGYFCSGTTCVSTGAAGSTCATDDQCGSKHCVDGVCCTVSSCAAPTKCNATLDGTCSKPLGATCAADGECGKGHCVDGLCCNSTCTGQCEACDVSGSEGTCTQVISGAPHAARTKCAGTGACQGKCDGSSRTACGAAPGTSTICAAASCTGVTVTSTAFCDGLGACAAGSASSCGAYRCGGTACKTTCTTATTTTDCNDGYVCKGSVCVTTGGLGTVCLDDSECTSTHCVDGGGSGRVCCSTATCPSGAVCAAAGGTATAGSCTKPEGQACGGSGECATGFCVDGVCCDKICDGQCEACDGSGTAGKCSGVRGDVHGSRTKCADGSGDVCKALQCDGAVDRLKCASFKASLGTRCGDGTCVSGTATNAPTCDGAGTCKPGSTSACGAYACSGKACNTSCVKGSDCASGYDCDPTSKTCVPQSSKCTDDLTAAKPSDGSSDKPCAPYLCDKAAGNCFAACTSADQCQPSYTCDGKACVPGAVPDAGSSGGCAIGAPRSASLPLIGLAAMLVTGLGAMARRRRRR